MRESGWIWYTTFWSKGETWRLERINLRTCKKSLRENDLSKEWMWGFKSRDII